MQKLVRGVLAVATVTNAGYRIFVTVLLAWYLAKEVRKNGSDAVRNRK
jgi:hypothetical protein